MNPRVKAFFDEQTSTVSYVVTEPVGPHCAIIDSVLDFDHKSGRTATTHSDQIIAFVRENSLAIDWIIETHAHADHLTAAPYLKRSLGGRTAIGRHITEVQSAFKELFNIDPAFAVTGEQFDHLFQDDEQFRIGEMTARVMHTPGHTPACLTYVIGDAAFVGDTLFMPDYGTARADFPGGDAAALYRSIQKVLSLPSETRLFTCHDYPPDNRGPAWEATVAQQRDNNVHVHKGVGEEEFVNMRVARDKTLSVPTLLIPSVQVNIRAGEFPPPEENGVSYLKLPLNAM